MLVVGVPGENAPAELREASHHGFGLLREQLADDGIAEVLLESDAALLADRIVADLAHHDADAEE